MWSEVRPGYHRFKLIQSSIDNFQEWWLCGIPSTAHWGYFMFDVTNQYVLEGVRSGIVAMIAFIWMLVYAFKHVGETWPGVNRNGYLTLLAWALRCVDLLPHERLPRRLDLAFGTESPRDAVRPRRDRLDGSLRGYAAPRSNGDPTTTCAQRRFPASDPVPA